MCVCVGGVLHRNVALAKCGPCLYIPGLRGEGGCVNTWGSAFVRSVDSVCKSVCVPDSVCTTEE